ncbi:unnamed protein product [Oikopleura dioica]|uniref:WD repeat-containing protein 92 n=1 Tax=Oikopleura dioica TaxID=34765 RepID=E4YGU6_OIKDI|nr:unnamed protein product [Oikopleura dioica]
MDISKPQILTYAEKSVNYTVHCSRWIPQSNRFVALGERPRGTGAFQIYELNGPEIKNTVDTEKTGAFRCGTFKASDTRQLAVGDFHGKMSIIDLENHSKPVYVSDAHNGIINSIDGCGGARGHGAPEIVTGGKDGCVRVWDPRQKNVPVAEIEPEDGQKENARDCWAVAFGNAFNAEDRMIAAGFDNGDVKLFDLKAMKIQWSTNIQNGVCSLSFDRMDIEMNKLVASTLENKIHIWDLRTQHKTEGFAHHVNDAATSTTVWSACHLPQNRDIFATAGGNGTMNVWQYKYPDKRVEEKGGEKVGVAGTAELIQKQILATQPINCIDFHPDKCGLAVMSGYDQALRVALVSKLNNY